MEQLLPPLPLTELPGQQERFLPQRGGPQLHTAEECLQLFLVEQLLPHLLTELPGYKERCLLHRRTKIGNQLRTQVEYLP
jgi:hypothetical protein